MFIANELRKTNIAEYLLYMWQVEDTIRAFDCSISRIRREYIERFDYTDEQKEDEADWFGNLIRMMNQEGCREQGHLQIIGSALLLGFGVYTYRSDPTKNMRKSGMQRGTIWYNMWTAFLVTFSNPLIIFLFMALFAQFAFVIPDHPFEMFIGFASIVGGAMLWWYGLSWLVDKIRTIFDAQGIRIINRIIGAVVIIFSFVSLFGTVTNLFRFF